ncbi:MAG: 23S rRNA (uracil(1939)-C(5))-methyltransferase RlmD [Clostridia bacterium]|nr:23S rRNA (uracil(1939)-C(5))-methyltransferase RlmD [Clostridia bacterium]
MNKNEIITLSVTDINPDGNGVGRGENGEVVFVPLTAPGDIAKVRIIKCAKNYFVGRLEELVSPSPLRVEPDCPVYHRCGGCVYRHLSREAELQIKKQTVENAFKRIGHLDVTVADTVSFDFSRYRNKVVYPLGRNNNGDVTFGYYARHTHAIVEHETCPLQEDLFSQIAMFHVKQSEKHHIPVWNEQTGKGILRHIAMRKNRKGDYFVCFTAAKPFPKAKLLAEELMEAFPQVIGVALNINPKGDNVIFGEETLHLAGEPTLKDTLCGKEFSISPTAFYQVNPVCTEALYQKAAELADLPENGVLLDLYCGAGTIGLSMAGDSHKLCGVEIVPEAVENAKRNAKNNGRREENTLFLCGDASLGVDACRKAFGDPDVIVVDPPRKGLSDEVIKTLLDVAPKKIVYISCNPATLAANCEKLSYTYEIGVVTPFNMFPRTGHVESIVCLERR